MADENKKADPKRRCAAAAAGPAAEEAGRQLATLEGRIADLTDRLLRAHAEMDNLRKRTERDKEDTAKYAITKFARDVLPWATTCSAPPPPCRPAPPMPTRPSRR